METKNKILALLENKKGEFLSGEEIAKKLNLSRTAVWKNIKALKNDGHNIIGLRNKGYSLSVNSDIVSPQGIERYLKCDGLTIEVFKQLSSTNTYAREKAIEGEREGYVVIAQSQTNGKGRKGRSFYSPEGSGLYMSILLRPSQIASEAVKLTTIAAVAVCEAIEALSDDKASIKWVNDVFVNDKKVCGILTEASISMENGNLEYVVLGIGVNVSESDFPVELKDIAGHINLTACGGKNRLAAEILNRFFYYYRSGEDFIDKYRNRCFVIGKNILVLKPNGTKEALALNVDDSCRLTVKYADGTTEHLSSGEISIKVKEQKYD